MLTNFYFLFGLIFLILFQIVVLPLNLAFAAIFGVSLFTEKGPTVVWIIVLALIFSLVSNQNLGLVLAGFAASLLLLEFLVRVLPRNNLVKGGLIVSSLLVCELSFVLFVNLLG